MQNSRTATVNHFDSAAHDTSGEKPAGVNIPLVGRSVDIADMRGHESEFSFDVQGFALVRHSTTVQDVGDADEINRAYYPEMDELLRAATGCTATYPVHGPVVRVSSRERRHDAKRPIEYAHGDYHPAWGEATLRKVMPSSEAESRLGRRYAMFNMWRTVSPPPQDFPLALCDPRSVAAQDKQTWTVSIPTEGYEEPVVWDTLVLRHNPDHRWFYCSDMTETDVLIFRSFDSGRDHENPVFHSAFVDRMCPDDAPARVSIEVRMFAFYDE